MNGMLPAVVGRQLSALGVSRTVSTFDIYTGDGNMGKWENGKIPRLALSLPASPRLKPLIQRSTFNVRRCRPCYF